MKELQLDAVIENLDAVLSFINAELEAMDCSLKIQNQIALAAEEIFVNIANYAYNPETGHARVRVKASGGELRLIFEDSGKPYNPLAKPDPDITGSAHERPIGGLGILMVKNIMDTVEYCYENGKNLLTMTKTI